MYYNSPRKLAVLRIVCFFCIIFCPPISVYICLNYDFSAINSDKRKKQSYRDVDPETVHILLFITFALWMLFYLPGVIFAVIIYHFSFDNNLWGVVQTHASLSTLTDSNLADKPYLSSSRRAAQENGYHQIKRYVDQEPEVTSQTGLLSNTHDYEDEPVQPVLSRPLSVISSSDSDLLV